MRGFRSRFTFHQCGRCQSGFKGIEGGELGKEETIGEEMYIKKKNVSKERSEGILVYDIVK